MNVSSILCTSTYSLYEEDIPYLVWEGGTILELMWNGSAWIVMGNPVIAKANSGHYGYRVYADKYAEIWGNNYDSSVSEQYITYDVTYPFYFLNRTWYSASAIVYSWYNENTLGNVRIAAVGIARISAIRAKYQCGYPSSADTHRGIGYKVSGYLDDYSA